MTELLQITLDALPVAEAELGDIARGMLGMAPQDKAAAHRRPVPPWRAALDQAIAEDPQGKHGVALRLGVSRPYVSRITTGHIPEASPRFVERVRATYLQVQCPHLARTLPPADCRRFAGRSYAELGPDGVDHWRACRRCPSNPITRAAALGLPKLAPGDAAEVPADATASATATATTATNTQGEACA